MKYTQPLVRSVFFLSLLLLIFYTTFASVRLIAHIEVPHRAKAKKVAIIGAGAGGTSAAYWISEAFGNSSIQVESTIFEKSNYVGGRSTTVTLKRDEKEYIIEVGASIFIDANLHLFNSAKRFGLEFTKFGGEFPGARVGIWDGEQLVFEESSYSYWDMVKILWKYGWAPLKVRNMVKATITKFMKIYQFEDPFTCIESAVDQLDLRTEHEKSAEYYFIEMKSLYPLYLQHFVEPATRVNYASNLNQIHAMGGFISLAPQGAKSIKGGNFQIFEKWAKHSGAKVKLQTSVVKIIKLPVNERFGISPKYSVVTQHGDSDIFDAVILAAPIQFTGIEFENINFKIEKIPYTTLHVTLIAGHVNPAYFGCVKDDDVPAFILTTNSGKTDFFSIGCQYLLENGERLCKIFSPHEMTNELLGQIFLDRSWTYFKVWKAYPRLLPNQTFPQVEPDENFFYPNSFEPFISTMETSAISTKNIIDILKERWNGNPFKAKM